MIVKLLTEHHLEFLSLKGGCTGSPESTLVKIPHCLKSHVTAQMISFFLQLNQDVYKVRSPVIYVTIQQNERITVVGYMIIKSDLHVISKLVTILCF